MFLKGKSFLKILDFDKGEILELLDLAAYLKAKKVNGIKHRLCEGKNIALIFEKTSTRTRCAFEVASYDLGMNAVYLDPSSAQFGKKESIKDTARVLGKMFDAIEYRGFGQDKVDQLAKYSKVPVINGLTDESHPTQVLADLLTIWEYFKNFTGLKLVFMGDARFNMANSLMVGCAKMGINFTACAPKTYFPDKQLIDKCNDLAEISGAELKFETDPIKATKDANILYTDVWVSMGESKEVWKDRINELSSYTVTMDLIKNADSDCKFMHCLPAYHDLETQTAKEIHKIFGLEHMEVTNDVFESEHSIVFDEAENRMHTIKAVIAASLSEI